MHRVLGVAHLDRDLVLDLLQAHFCLPKLQLRSNLDGLRRAIAQRDVQRYPGSFVRPGRVKQLVKCASIAYRRNSARWDAKLRIRWDADWNGVTQVATNTRTAIVSK